MGRKGYARIVQKFQPFRPQKMKIFGAGKIGAGLTNNHLLFKIHVITGSGVISYVLIAYSKMIKIYIVLIFKTMCCSSQLVSENFFGL